MHEEDYGILWKHTDWRTGYTEVAAVAAAGRLVHRHGRQLRVRLLLVLLPGRHDPVRGQADRRHLERRDAAGRDAAVGRAGRAAGVRADPPALLQRAARHDGRRTEQLGLRGQHRGRSARARTTRTTTPSTPRRRCWRPESQAQRVIDPLSGALLEDRQPVVANRLGQPVGYKLMPGENVAAVRAPEASSVLKRAAFMTQAPVGDAVRPARAVRRRRLPEPAPRRRRPARLHQRRPPDRRTPTSWSGTRSARTTSCGPRTGR